MNAEYLKATLEKLMSDLDKPCDAPTCSGTMECVEHTVVQRRGVGVETSYVFVCDTCFLSKVI